MELFRCDSISRSKRVTRSVGHNVKNAEHLNIIKHLKTFKTYKTV